MDIELEFSLEANHSLDEFLKKKNLSNINYKILKRSLDARGFPKYLYRIVLSGNNTIYKTLKQQRDIKVDLYKKPSPVIFNKTKQQRKIFVVGAGPAGLFAADTLCKRGFDVIVVERGKPINQRDKDVACFYKTGVLDENSNIQFGEGGAGTYSDGKLATRVKDSLKDYVFEIFHSFGAKEDVMYESKPHVGTDIIRTVVTSLRQDLEKRGVEFRFSSVLESVEVEKESIKAIVIKDLQKNIEYKEHCNTVIVCCGNSARDTFEMLKSAGAAIQDKPIAVGYRVIHPQRDIDFARYSKKANGIHLPPADYSLTFNKNGYGVYSFCMCPGGYVINASSQKNKLVINGMSNSKRDSGYANSAIVVTIKPTDVKESMIKFQKEIEKKTFTLSKDGTKIPAMSINDFMKNEETPKKIENPKGILPGLIEAPIFNIYSDYPFINSLIREAFVEFDKKMKGKWLTDDAIILASETRTSSPVTILRDENRESVSIKGIFVAGEGSGYAGGITSSAIDGIRVALNII